MQITLLGVIAVVVFGFLGYSRGAYRIAAAFTAFFIAALLADPVSHLLVGLVVKSKRVPLALTPLAAQLFAGLILFLLVYGLAAILLRKLEDRREERDRLRLALWERLAGAALGTAWGAFLFLFVLTGIHLIGSVAEALNRSEPAAAAAEPAAPVPARSRPVAVAVETAAPPKAGAADAAARPTLEKRFVALKKQIEGSALAPVVRKADPVNDGVAQTFRNLSTVVNDPVLYGEFKRHPLIARLAQDPRLLAVSEDQQIQQQLQDKNYYALLDNDKIAALLQDEALVRDLRKVNLGEILQEVRAGSDARSLTAGAAARAARCDKCLGGDGHYKDAFPSERDASAQALLFEKKYGLKLYAYACPYGNGWHLTKTKSGP